jgi:CRISPR-associated endonuclease/helicase Cas3
MTTAVRSFDRQFAALTGFEPLAWQRRLFARFVQGDVPSAVDVPTGLGKTSVMAIWLIARAHRANLPRRLVYIVDRRAVVDQATAEAEKLRNAFEGKPGHFDVLDFLKKGLGLDDERKLPISTLRGAHVDNREWLDDPAAPAIIVGTVDMIGSRLLFEGYGVSRKMRPYQAGLLGIDALVVLDEAHLVPPFAHLLQSIEQDASLQPAEEGDRALLPRFTFLPLSATQRDAGEHPRGRAPLRLEEEDWNTDRVAKVRLEASKRLQLAPLAENDHDQQLAQAAWALAKKDGRLSRVAVFCDRRDKNDDGGGPSAQGVKDAIERLAKGDGRAGRATVDIHPPELLVGARRVRERDLVERSLRRLGFIGKKDILTMPAFLIATSAGEVGVDIDADHMICDLVAWERLVQRLGRVNRRGEGNAEIKLFWKVLAEKDAKALTEPQNRALTAFATKAVIESLPKAGGAFDASPGALRQLAEKARGDARLKARIDAATTPEPLRPALSRPLVDAWSMTSLERHTGRPDVAPWLRGWVEEKPQTSIVWRSHLPIRTDESGRTILPAQTEIQDFFEAAPPHESEKLETETYRVMDWLQKRGSALLEAKSRVAKEGLEDEDVDPEASMADDPAAEQSSVQTVQATKLRRDNIVALLLSSSGAFEGRYTLGDLARERQGNARKEFEDEFIGKILILDARFGGLKDGLLDAASDEPVETADESERWSREAQFRVRRVISGPDSEVPTEEQEDGWHFEDELDLRRNDEGKPVDRLVVEHFRAVARKEDARSIARPQELVDHQERARSALLRIVEGVGLAGGAAAALAVGAALHDEGKKALRWQRAFKAARDAQRFGLVGPLAKTRGPIDQAVLGGYRHELGSLPYLEQDAAFKALPDDWRELVLHLVAAHHGRARPVIETRGCEDGPPSLLEESACAIALRFARLQKRWGPWGLAWWEALMRAADQQASREEDGRAPCAKEGDR